MGYNGIRLDKMGYPVGYLQRISFWDKYPIFRISSEIGAQTFPNYPNYPDLSRLILTYPNNLDGLISQMIIEIMPPGRVIRQAVTIPRASRGSKAVTRIKR
jgi:hypothetical protein